MPFLVEATEVKEIELQIGYIIGCICEYVVGNVMVYVSDTTTCRKLTHQKE